MCYLAMLFRDPSFRVDCGTPVFRSMHRADSKATKIDVEGRGNIPTEKKEHVYMLGLDLTGTSPTVQLILLSVGVFFFYLMYGYMQVSSCFCILLFSLPRGICL